ncbi:MAG: hypothetical protein M0R38_12355 [Bacteroidia bacterium]|nr:hypothetical protein [Bacteroidia bacterium]
MATPYSDVYGSFLARIEEDDWIREEETEVVEADLFEILKMAVFDFRFPRIVIEFDPLTASFTNVLTNAEIQVLATLMKLHWLRRQVNTWRVIKQQYSTKDFELSSQANHLDKLLKSLEFTEKEVRRVFDTYDRSRNGSPFSFRNLAGGEPDA